MRINKFLALHTSLSRRGADEAIARSRVTVNGRTPSEGQQINPDDSVILDGKEIKSTPVMQTIILNKPVGYVCSRNGQGSKTIYDLLPKELQHLNSIGRLDKDSSGLLLLTNDGQLAQELTHPKYQKTKIYQVTLDKPLQPLHQQMISETGVHLSDGPSKFIVEKSGPELKVTMREGRNRQIRRTFEALGYKVTRLHRISFNDLLLDGIKPGKYKRL